MQHMYFLALSDKFIASNNKEKDKNQEKKELIFISWETLKS